MKKGLLFLTLSLLGSIVLSGCGGGSEPTKPTEPTNPSVTDPSAPSEPTKPSEPSEPTDPEIVVLRSISLSGTAKKTVYEEGDSFDPTGLTVTAIFSDESTKNVTKNVSWTPNPLTLGTTEVTGNYLGKTVKYSGITVNEKTIIIKEITVYLVLTKIGLFDGQKGENFPELSLENAIKYKSHLGSELPGADRVTSTSGAKFENWMAYDGGGAPTRYEVVPNYEGKILYANFGDGSGTVTPTVPAGEYTFEVDCSKLLSWNPPADGFSIHAWGDNGATGNWGGNEERMQAGENNVYTISFEYAGTLQGAIFYFYQNGATKQTGDLTTTFEAGATYVITYDDANWPDGKMSASIAKK